MSLCARCGAAFSKNRAFQKFCKLCQRERKRETDKASAAARYRERGAEFRAANALWHRQNREKRNAHDRAYFAQRPEFRAARNRATKHSRRGAPGQVTPAEAREIMSHPCAYCGAPATHLEHCTPLSRGGWNTADNLVAACASCNLRKGTQTVLEFLGLWPRVR